MNIIFAGKGKALVKIILFALEKIEKSKILILPVDSDNGESDWQVSVKKLASIYGIQTITYQESKNIENCVFVSVQFDKILRPKEFKTSRIYNIHFSYLPYYKGVYPMVWPILNQEEFSGVTLHFIDDGIDTGNIIDQQKIFLDKQINSFELYQICCELALQLFKINYTYLIKHEDVLNRRQDLDVGSYYSKTSLDMKNYNVNYRKTASEVSAQLRAFMFKPYQMPLVNQIEVNDIEILNERDYKNAGKIVHENEHEFLIATIDYIVKAKKDYSKVILDLFVKGDFQKGLYLIKKFNLNKLQSKEGWTPLMVASFQGEEKVVQELIELGFDVNEKNFKGTTVLMYAKSNASKTSDLSVMNLLMKNGSKISVADDYGKNIMYYSILEGNKLVIDFIKENIVNE